MGDGVPKIENVVYYNKTHEEVSNKISRNYLLNSAKEQRYSNDLTWRQVGNVTWKELAGI